MRKISTDSERYKDWNGSAGPQRLATPELVLGQWALCFSVFGFT
jgi:hypothetical protein